MVATDFGGRQMGWLEPLVGRIPGWFGSTKEVGGQRLTHVVLEVEDGVTGKYFTKNKITEPSKNAQSNENAEYLWKKSEEWTGIRA